MADTFNQQKKLLKHYVITSDPKWVDEVYLMASFRTKREADDYARLRSSRMKNQEFIVASDRKGKPSLFITYYNGRKQ